MDEGWFLAALAIFCWTATLKLGIMVPIIIRVIAWSVLTFSGLRFIIGLSPSAAGFLVAVAMSLDNILLIVLAYFLAIVVNISNKWDVSIYVFTS